MNNNFKDEVDYIKNNYTASKIKKIIDIQQLYILEDRMKKDLEFAYSEYYKYESYIKCLGCRLKEVECQIILKD